MPIIEITVENFQTEVVESDKPVLLDFWAPWCGPCKMLSPIVDEIAEERDDIKVGKINVDEQGKLGLQFDVMGIPTLLLMNKGEIQARSIGYKPKKDVLELLP